MKGLLWKALILALGLSLANAHSYRSPLEKFHGERIKIAHEPKIEVSVSPTLLNNSGEWVTVQFSGVPKPNATDFIAVYSPYPTNVTAQSPVKYQYCNFSSEYMSTGSGSLTFRLVNMHSEYVFGFLRNGTDYPIFITLSNVVEFSNYEQPNQPHLSLTTQPNMMQLSWASGAAIEQWVRWGTQSGVYTNVAGSVATTYSSTDLCGSPAKDYGWKDPGMLHNVNIEFDPNTDEVVYYQFGSNDTTWSPEYFFRVPPPVAASSGIRFAAYGDMGKGEIDKSEEHWEEIPAINTTLNVANLVAKGAVDLVLHIGDISYAVGYSAQWDEFMDQISYVAGYVPYMTLPGNHERDFPGTGSTYNGTDSGGECGIPYETRFPMPGVSHNQQWYSFNFGNVHFVQISTELNFTRGSPQWTFVLNDLQSVDNSVTPWIIFSGHRPMYIDSVNNDTKYNGAGDLPVAHKLQEAFEEMFVKYQVDLAFWGHHHSYQRTCPVFNGTCYDDQPMPVHVVIGMAGMGLSEIRKTPNTWIELVDNTEFGYSVIETTEKTLHMQFFSNANVLRDEFTLYK